MKEFTCIVCPKGCHLVYHDDGTVTGNTCKRGEKYATSEASAPVRFVTSTVLCENGSRCPVRTSSPAPKEKMFEIMAEIRNIKLKTPIQAGDVILKNICNTGIDLISTATME